MAVHYDESVLKEHSAEFYRKARWTVARCAFLGILLGYIGCGLLGNYLAIRDIIQRDVINALAYGGLFVGALCGGWFGSNRAFMLRVEAQKILLQIQIEKNTRREGESAQST